MPLIGSQGSDLSVREEDKPFKNPSGEVNVNKILQTSEGQDRDWMMNYGKWKFLLLVDSDFI